MGYRCERCGHEWLPRGRENGDPLTCPVCRSAYWNSPRKAKSLTSYENFRDTVEQTLRAAGKPLTWTEIRTQAKLPQAFPNNKWVHELEKQIGLERKRDKNGVIHWHLKQ